MEKSTNDVKYEPLPADGSQIRLVTILPGATHKKVKCKVDNFQSAKDGINAVEYEALSYVWGDATITTPITLNSHPFQVTTNLEAALRALRFRKKKRLIWIDAICINQTSISERNQEVRRMSEIYGRAKHVIVWLGRGTEPSDRVQVEDNRIAEKTIGMLNSLADARSEDSEAGAVILGRTGDPACAIRLLHRFFFRPWFNRIWILQEVTLAKTATIVYDDLSISWDRLVQAVDALRRLQIGRHTHVWRLSGAANADRVERCWMRTRSQDKPRTSIYLEMADLLWQTRFHEWTEPRDRLYGILGLVGSHLRSERLLEVDYTKSVVDVFRDLSIFMIQGGMLSHVLCSIANSMDGLPSWASNWTAELEGATASRLSPGIMMSMQIYQFNGTESPSNPPRFSDDLLQMTIKGYIFDYGICHIGKRYEPTLVVSVDARAELVRSRLIEWEDEMERQSCAHKLYETKHERRNAWRNALLHELPDETSELRRHYNQLTDREKELPLAKDSGAILMSIVTDLDATLGLYCDYRRPFVTMLGLMGSTGTNCDLRFGDLVCVCVGSGVPYILRPVDQSKNIYRFVGCSWLPALVNLDLVEGERNGSWEIHDITLI
ncbi:heterokaryon incompatibility protein-domain-containing protein [Jackrogersella minutella]|nr:heterokaryon incompatibility protein-domain-containing protein [Jackrogersella minutella]